MVLFRISAHADLTSRQASGKPVEEKLAKQSRLRWLPATVTLTMPGLTAYVPRCFREVHTKRNIYTQNEHEVGNAIKESGVPREDIFITSKVRDRLGIDVLNY